MTDPIAELVHHLMQGHPPPLAWLLRWSAAERDPVAAAWAVSTDWLSMLQLTGVSQPLSIILPLPGIGWTSTRGETCGALRQLVGQPPTLDELLAKLPLPSKP